MDFDIRSCLVRGLLGKMPRAHMGKARFLTKQMTWAERIDAMADAKDQAKDAIDEDASKAKQATETVAGKADETLSHVRDSTEPALERAQAGYRQVAEHTQEGIRQAGAVVRGNPGISVSAAFGVGIAIGVVIGIRLRPSKRDDLSSYFHRPSWLG
jgi:ElaB/YqjD/DUF883 family membrane-anchored ribosome-binding protein